MQEEHYDLITAKKSCTANDWGVCYQMTKNNKNICPGQMQYKVLPEHILNMNTLKLPDTSTIDGNILFERHTKENLARLTPNTKTGNSSEWGILLIISHSPRSEDGNTDADVYLKGALLNKTTREIALMTSMNNIAAGKYANRVVRSHDPLYKICQAKFIAPILFWRELKNRLDV